jgi:hypothetical protein
MPGVEFLRRGQNAIESILVDHNAIMPTPAVICSAAPIEKRGRESCLFGKRENTPAVVRLVQRIGR